MKHTRVPNPVEFIAELVNTNCAFARSMPHLFSAEGRCRAILDTIESDAFVKGGYPARFSLRISSLEGDQPPFTVVDSSYFKFEGEFSDLFGNQPIAGFQRESRIGFPLTQSCSQEKLNMLEKEALSPNITTVGYRQSQVSTKVRSSWKSEDHE